uniref:Rhodanese domain-containing protein n=1 Tax=Caenorhabditis tropicalis TaxID=1561998 RepID=A0A1I7U8B9_9PELO
MRIQVYGFTNVSLLNGGLDAWKTAGGSTNNEEVKPTLGNVDIRSLNSEILVNFEQIPFNHLAENKIDYLDARIPSQFTGQDPLATTYPGTKATGSHVTGAINFPMAEVIGPNGFLSQEEVDAKIAKLGLKSENQVFVACNTGIQASVIFTALERSGIKLYNGSMTELAYRAPEVVNASGN